MSEKKILSIIFFANAFVIAFVISESDICLFFLIFFSAFLIPFFIYVVLGMQKKQTFHEWLSSDRTRDDSDEFDEILGLKEKVEPEKDFDEIIKKY
jgi:hypothetical protein